MAISLRDVTVSFLTKESGIVVACDSSASIGLKIADQLKVDPKITSAFCLRVALLEVLAIGGEPVIVINSVGGEMEPTGRQSLAGIKAELRAANLEHVGLNGSTEENILTKMTSIAVTVIGTITKATIKYGRILAGSSLYQVGLPLVGAEVIQQRDQIFTYQDLGEIQKNPSVLEILPVGSKGIFYEATQLAKSSGLGVSLTEKQGSFSKSAGPATVLLVALEPGAKLELVNQEIFVKKIGCFDKEG